MSRIGFLGPRAFAGDFTPYSKALASFGMWTLVAAGSRQYAFAASHPLNGRPCCIIPLIEPERIQVATFYSVRRAFTPGLLAKGNAAAIVADWTRYCRAFTVTVLEPASSRRFQLLDCNTTRLAQNELMQATGTPDFPSLETIDQALGTGLEFVDQPADWFLQEGLAPWI